MSTFRVALALAALTLALALAFQGTRGVWEPDEGYYIGAARSMVESGDWTVPQVNLRPFLEKPPLVYWGSASGMVLFGFNEWAARLGNALWLSLTVLVVGLLGRGLGGNRLGAVSALCYLTMPLPFVAANMVTPDTPLAIWTTASMASFWMAVSAPKRGSEVLWKFSLGLCLGLGILAKGPAILVLLGPMGLYLLLTGQVARFLSRWETLPALTAAAAIGGSWYVLIHQVVPGALAYAWDNQIMGRLFTEKYDRNPEFYKPFVIYLPILVVGSLPWSVAWFARIGAMRESFAEWRRDLRSGANQPTLFLALWVLVPLAVFFVAKSRLVLYILPLFAPVAILSARCWLSWKPAWFEPRWNGARAGALAVWCLVLVISRLTMAHWPTDKDTRAFWNSLKDLIPEGRRELVVVNGIRHGLSFYSGGNVEWVTTRTDPYPTFFMPETFESEVHELPTSREYHVFLVRDPRDYTPVLERLSRTGFPFEDKPGPSGHRLLICPPAPEDRHSVSLAAMGDTRSGDSLQIQLGSALYHVDEERTLNGVILLGDNLAFEGDPRYFEEHFERPYNPLLRNGVRFFAVLGNQDVSGGFAGFQINHPLLGMRGRRYYSRVFGDGFVEVFFLDSTTLATDRAQRAWLARELATSPASWKVVAMHHPLYGSSLKRETPLPNLRAQIEPILIEGGADIVLSGHHHFYQRIRPQHGIHYFIAGSGGKVAPGTLNRAASEFLAGEDQTTIALLLEFTADSCRFEAIDSMERVVDKGTLPADPAELASRTGPVSGDHPNGQ